MDKYTACEQAYTNGYSAGYEAGRRSVLGGDVESVVRCKDCKYFIEPTATDGLCELDCNARIIWRNDDFCSYGERKTNETNNL